MIEITPQMRVLVAIEPVDGRKGRQPAEERTGVFCQRYLKIPRIHRLKNPQLRPKPSILTRGGLGCCDWRVLWRYRSCIMTE
jgi:hypothetical protein